MSPAPQQKSVDCELRSGLLSGLMLSLALGVAVSAPAAAVIVTDHGLRTSELPNHRRQQRREIALVAGDTHYVLHFRHTEHLNDAGEPTQSYASIGIECATGGRGRHQGVGWYMNEAMRLFVDGQDLTTTGGRLRTPQILGRGEVGLVEAVLEHAKASVHLRFALRSGQEGIDVQARFEVQPSAEGRPRVVRFSCYPAFFTAWNKRRGDRWVVTPTREIEEPREPDLDLSATSWKHQVRAATMEPDTEWWLFYHDRFFNTDRGKGKGLCGLVLRPEDLESIDLQVTDYEITTSLLLKPEVRSVRFTLWQRNVRDYLKPLAEFPQVAESARQRLETQQLFARPALAAFDVAAEQGRLESGGLPTRARDEVAAALSSAAAATAAWRVAEAPGRRGLESTAYEAVQGYRRRLWQARRGVPRRFRLLIAKGAHFPAWRVAEAAGRCPQGATVDDSFFTASWRGEWLGTFPGSDTEMLQYDAVVLVNVSAKPFEGAPGARLKQFVADGGGVLVLGGFHAYGGGGYADSVLADLLPVTCGGPFDVVRLPQAAAIARAEPVSGLAFAEQLRVGAVRWLHALPVKPGVHTVLTAETAAGARPFLVLGAHGRGRTAACLGTVYGESPGSGPTVAFHDAPGWPGVLARTLTWVASASATAPLAGVHRLDTEAAESRGER